MTEALRAEWTKLRTLAVTRWLLAAIVAVSVGVSAAASAVTHVSSGGGGQDPTKLALVGVDLGQAVVVVLAALAIAEEYGTGMIRVSLTAMPRRHLLLAAKAANIVAVVLAASILAVAGCLLAGRLLLPGAGIGPAHGYPLLSLAHTATLRAAAGNVVYLTLIALLALGIAAAIRDTAVSVGAALALLYLPPLLAQLVSGPLRRHLQQLAPMTAGLASQATTSLGSQPIGPWAGLGVVAAWAFAALLVGGLLLRWRDP
jgi:ABC-2 type transport system permease protein